MVVVVGAVLPVTPLAPIFGFTTPPWCHFLLLSAAVVVYLLLVEIAKQQLVKRLRL